MSDPIIAPPTPSPLRVTLSGVSGSTSIACYVVTLLPQLIEQWRLKSSEGLSIKFVSIWFLGDVFNLAGAVWAGLLPEAIILAVWFCVTDLLMIASYFYYAKVYPKRHHRSRKNSKKHNRNSHNAETSPLIAHTESNLRRSSVKSRRNSIDSLVLEPQAHSVFTRYVLPLIFVTAAGTFGYFISPLKPSHDVPDTPLQDEILIGPQILGYLSAFLYLTARIPQIFQNYKHKSCEGLSLLFFIFSVYGNFTYAMQIFFYRSDWPYIKLYMSWILGSLGTTFEDFTIFAQFYLYRPNKNSVADTEAVIAQNNQVFDEE